MNNEQQAFPIFTHEQVHIGMTLRDYFAAKALPELIHSYMMLDPKKQSKKAYEFADAMLKQREVKP